MPRNKLKQNFFLCPNFLVDDLMRHLTPAENLLLFVIIRKTAGWNKICDPISLKQFRELTGIKSNKTLLRALKRLCDDRVGLVHEEKSPGRTTVYRLGKLYYGKKYTRKTSVKITQVLGAKNTQVTPITYVKNTHTKYNINKKIKGGGSEIGENIEFAADREDLIARGKLIDLVPFDGEDSVSFRKRLVALERLGRLYADLQS